MSNYKNKQTLRKPVWQDIIFRTCMEVRFITAVTRGLFFFSPFQPLAPRERKIEPLAPRVTGVWLSVKKKMQGEVPRFALLEGTLDHFIDD